MFQWIRFGILSGIFFFFYPDTAWAGCSKCKERGQQLLKKEREEKKDVADYDTSSTDWNRKPANRK